MSNFSTRKTETFAINDVNNLCEHPLLYSNLLTNDKTPSIDGTIELYINKKQRKEDLFDIITVQVKSESDTKKFNSKLCKYKMVRSDLENFKKSLGIIFFVGIVDDNNNEKRLFYKKLFPDTIQELLDAMKNKKPTSTIMVKFEELYPKTKDNFYNLINNFAQEHHKLQESAKIVTVYLSEIEKYNLKDVKFNLSYNKRTKKYSFDSDNFGTAKTKLEQLVYLKNDANSISIFKTGINVSIKGHLFYKNREIETNIVESKNFIKLSKNLTLTDDSIVFDIDENERLVNLLYDINFFIELKKEKILNIDNMRITFNIKNDLSSLIDLKEDIENMFNLCDKLNFDKNNLIFKYIDDDYFFLLKLSQKENFKPNSLISALLSNRIYQFINFEDNELKELFNSNIAFFYNRNQKNYLIPNLTIFDFDTLKQMNLNENIIEHDLSRIKESEVKNIEEDLNNLALNLIKLYDEYHKQYFLDNALYIIKILESHCNIDFKNIVQLNHIQINIRLNKELDKYDRTFLNEILLNSNDITYKFVANVLLKNKKEATDCFNDFNEDEKQLFSKLPIITIFNAI